MSWHHDWEGLFWPATCGLSIILVVALHVAVPRSTAADVRTAAPSPALPPTTSEVVGLGERFRAAPSRNPDQWLVESVFECRQGGVTVFSDHRCGADAAVRAIRAPNLMEATPVYSNEEGAPAPIQAAPQIQIQASMSRGGTHDEICREIELEKDRIDARMREGYSSGEGEILRERRNSLSSRYYELRCKHFH
jgi:hypothetical protein